MVEMDNQEVNGGGSRIAENTIFLALSNAGSLIFTLIQLAILSRFLRREVFGLFVALRGFSLLLATVALLGLRQVLIRYFPSCQQRSQRNKAVGLFLFSTLVVLAAGAAIYATGGWWESLIPGKVSSYGLEGELLYWVILASIALGLKMLLYGGFNGLRVMRFQMIFELVYLAALTTFIVYSRESLSVLYLFKAIFILSALVFISGIPVLICQIMKHIPSRITRRVEGVELPPLFSYWMGALTMSLVALAFTDVDRFVMSSLLPLTAVSLFHVASRINSLLKRFLAIPVVAAQPEITRVYEEGRWDKISVRIGLFTKLILLISLSAIGITAVIGRDVIHIISGPEYSGAYLVMLILLLTVPLAAISAPLIAAMRGLNHIKWAVLCDFIWMACYFGTFAFFVSWWGISGMAVAQVVASLGQLALAVYVARRERFYGSFSEGVAKFLFCLVPVVGAGIFVASLWRVWGSLMVVVVSPFVLKMLLSSLNVFEPGEKRKIIELVPVALPRRLVCWFISAKGLC